jgi:hypothetical protein
MLQIVVMKLMAPQQRGGTGEVKRKDHHVDGGAGLADGRRERRIK